MFALPLAVLALVAPPTVRVACLGASITEGAGVKNPKQDSYPSVLARLMGPGYEVRNFGDSGHTMMDHGDIPYERSPRYRAALDFRPDIAVFLLGSNDSKPQNLERNPDDFVPSFRAKISALRAMNPKVRLVVCLLPPAFPENYGIRDSMIAREVNPRLARVAREERATVVDLHTPLVDKGALFPDHVHPNEEGAAMVARIVAARVRQLSG